MLGRKKSKNKLEKKKKKKDSPMHIKTKFSSGSNGLIKKRNSGLFKFSPTRRNAKMVCANCGRPTVKMDRKKCKSWCVVVAMILTSVLAAMNCYTDKSPLQCLSVVTVLRKLALFCILSAPCDAHPLPPTHLSPTHLSPILCLSHSVAAMNSNQWTTVGPTVPNVPPELPRPVN